MYFTEWNYIMTKFVMKSETFEDGAKVLRYYFLGKFPFLKKIKGTGVRKTFLFNYCISKHSAKVVKNSLDYSNLLMPSEVVDKKNTKLILLFPYITVLIICLTYLILLTKILMFLFD